MGEAARIDRIALVERLQAGLEAAKSVEMVAFARSRAVAHVRAGVHPRKAERGIADEIALACRVSPSEGSRRLHTARDLVLDMPQTLGLLGRGDLHAGNYVRELPGWTVKLLDPDDHTVVTITPTGHRYVSNPPEPP